MNLKQLSFLCAFWLVFISCEKETSIDQREPKDISFESQRRKFSSAVELDNYFNTYTADALSFKSIGGAELSSPIMALVEDEAIASVFNRDGELTVADVTYKITNVGTFYAKNEDFSKVAEFVEKDIQLFGKLQHEEKGDIPEILCVKRPNLSVAELVDEKSKIYCLAKGVFFKDGIEESEEGKEVVMDRDSGNKMYDSSYPLFRSGSNILPPAVFNGVSFSNAVTKEFTDKNGEVLHNFDKNTRLVVQIKSKNFVVFSYMKTVVRIDTKKKYWFGWRTLQNYDELRAGFVNLVLDFDLHNLSDPLIDRGQAPNIIDNGVNPYLKRLGNINLDDDTFDLYRLNDLLNLPDLPFGLRSEIENFLESPESFYADILNKQKNQLVNRITGYMKAKIDPMLSKNNFSFVIPQNNSLVTIPLLEKRKTSRGAIIELKEVQTALVKIGIGGNSTQVSGTPSKNPKVVSGAIFGAGKVNGQWKAGVLVKNKK